LNWQLASLTCSGDSGGAPTTVDLANRSASVGLDSGEAITCTFSNVLDVGAHRQQTLDIIRLFLIHRVNLLASDEPDRNHFFRRFTGALWGDDGTVSDPFGPSTPFSFSGADNGLSTQMSFSTSVLRMAGAPEDAALNRVQNLMAYAGPV